LKGNNSNKGNYFVKIAKQKPRLILWALNQGLISEGGRNMPLRGAACLRTRVPLAPRLRLWKKLLREPRIGGTAVTWARPRDRTPAPRDSRSVRNLCEERGAGAHSSHLPKMGGGSPLPPSLDCFFGPRIDLSPSQHKVVFWPLPGNRGGGGVRPGLEISSSNTPNCRTESLPHELPNTLDQHPHNPHPRPATPPSR